jgi:hypothetical protein
MHMLSHFWIAKPGALKFHDAYTYTFTDDQDSLSREYIENRIKNTPHAQHILGCSASQANNSRG